MPTLYYTDYSSPDFTQQRIIAAFLNQNLPSQQIPNKYSSLNLVDQNNFLIHQPNAISIYLASGSRLLGEQFEEEADVYSWLEYFNVQVHPLLQQVYAQIFGKSATNEKKYNYAIQELKKVFKIFDDKLKLKTYFVGNNLTLTDLIICCQLQTAFRLIITSEMRKKMVNLTRWYTYIRNLKPFVDCIGKMFLCEICFTLDFQTNDGQIINTKQTLNKEEKIKGKKQQQHVQKQSKKKKEKKQQGIGQQKKIQQNKQHKIKQQPQKNEKQQQQNEGKFSLDTFKRSFQNSDDKQKVIDDLLNNFPGGYSLWKVYYSKDVTEGKVDYLTSNLAKGTLQRLDALRKTGFGTWGVYHNQADKQYEIRGVMLWKGEEISQAWKQHPSFEYHIFHKMDPKNQEERQIVKSYWLQHQNSEGLTLYDSFKLI